MLPLSVVILTLNEASRMERCLKSLSQAKQVIIIDSYSQDGTLESARKIWSELGRDPARLVLITQAWAGFTQTRNLSIQWVTQPWVLWVDADEWVEEGLWTDLKTLIESETRAEVFLIPRMSFFLGRAIRFGGWYPDRKARLARNHLCEWRNGPLGADVHEDLYPKSHQAREILKTKFHLFHEGFRSVDEQFETNDRYSSLLAQGLASQWKQRQCRPPSRGWIAAKVLIKFFENYIWKLGILDGYPGYLIARGSAESMKMRLDKAKALLMRPASG